MSEPSIAEVNATGDEFEFSVIIPFFQRESGILNKAVTSALRQEGIVTPRVIVVDDGSPVSAQVELQNLLEKFPRHLIILKQDNGGPGAARNKGIELAKRDSRYIAFLDSDDIWASTHLAMAKTALDRGFDFYFCDTVHRDGGATIYSTKKFPASDYKALDREGQLFEYTGDSFELILTACPIHTSAVVYRAKAFSTLFRTDLRTSGEDYFFWLEVASHRQKTAFSTSPNVRLGRGISIFDSVGWASPEHLWQIFYNRTCMRDAEQRLTTSYSYRHLFRRQKQRYRDEFINSMMSAFLAGRRREIASIARKFFLSDPLASLCIPPVGYKRLRGRLRKHRMDS